MSTRSGINTKTGFVHTCKSWSWEKLEGQASLKLFLEIFKNCSWVSVTTSAGRTPVKLLLSRDMFTKFFKRPKSADTKPVRFMFDRSKPTTIEEFTPHVMPLQRQGLELPFTTQSFRWPWGSVMAAFSAMSARPSFESGADVASWMRWSAQQTRRLATFQVFAEAPILVAGKREKSSRFYLGVNGSWCFLDVTRKLSRSHSLTQAVLLLWESLTSCWKPNPTEETGKCTIPSSCSLSLSSIPSTVYTCHTIVVPPKLRCQESDSSSLPWGRFFRLVLQRVLVHTPKTLIEI